jgi:hypothetical protein
MMGTTVAAPGFPSHPPAGLRSLPNPLQGWQCELSALEDEASRKLPPRASLIKPFTFHHHIRHQA